MVMALGDMKAQLFSVANTMSMKSHLGWSNGKVLQSGWWDEHDFYMHFIFNFIFNFSVWAPFSCNVLLCPIEYTSTVNFSTSFVLTAKTQYKTVRSILTIQPCFLSLLSILHIFLCSKIRKQESIFAVMQKMLSLREIRMPRQMTQHKRTLQITV